MENCVSTDSSTSGDPSAICESSADPPDPSSGNVEQSTLNNLAICLNDSLNFDDSSKLTSDPISSELKDDTISLVQENEDERHGTKIGSASSEKCLDKCATFPCSSKMSAVVNNLEKEDEQITASSPQSCLSDSATRSCLRSASLPSTLKLVSAIKGSHEKLGNPPRKLSVTWDPDVYDPVPTAASHVPTNKSPRHRGNGKKNGRNKQKEGGKSSHGSSRSKDKKKQARKVNAGSSRCYKALVDDFPEGPLESLASMADFEVGSADALCGSSFLKKSVARLHFRNPVAEAT